MTEQTLYIPFYRKILFYSTTCHHCHACLKALRRIDQDIGYIPPSIKVERVDVDLNSSMRVLANRIARRLGENYLPTPLLVYGKACGIVVIKEGILNDDDVAYENFVRGLMSEEAKDLQLPIRIPKLRLS